MSSFIPKAKPWLLMLLDPTVLQQSKILLSKATDIQLNALREIFYNLVNNSELLSDPSIKNILKKRKWKILLKPRSFAAKRKFVKQNKTEILKILQNIEDLLLGLLDQHE